MTDYTVETLESVLSNPNIVEINRLGSREYYFAKDSALSLNVNSDFNYSQSQLEYLCLVTKLQIFPVKIDCSRSLATSGVWKTTLYQYCFPICGRSSKSSFTKPYWYLPP